MKKLLSKFKARKQPKEPVGRITNDTLAEHREKVLAGGRKFKYPVQYARHKLVINAIIIAISTLILLVAVGWYLLYPAQNTSEFMYRVTKVVPVPVATIDGQSVRYSDYLMKYRSALHYLVEKERVDTKTEDGKRQLTFIKNSSMDDAVADAYALKKAREFGMTVSVEEVEAFLKKARQAEGGQISEATQAGVLAEYYDWTMDEYRGVIAQKLLRQQVSYKVDDKARGIAASIEASLKPEGASLQAVAASLNEDKKDTAIYMPPVWLNRDNQDHGLSEAAAKLEKGQVSDAIKSPGDGYYYIKLIDANDVQVQFEYIYVPLTAFQEQLEAVKKTGRVTYFISIDSATTNKEES